jgi:DNA-binding transcriptional LysR family regulator
MNPSLNVIRGFFALAQHLHFGRAAKALGITQPALSNQIKAIEQSLGVRLFVRTTRWVRLTPEGERFLRRVRRVLSDLDSAFIEMSDPTAPPRGNVAFACIPTIAGHIFPRIINDFESRHPEIKITMIDEATVEMERRIANREVDFGVGGLPRRKDELAFASLFSDPFVLVCRIDHAVARHSRIAIKKVLDFPLISLGKDSNVRQTIENYFALAGRTFEPRFELNHHYTVGAMVEAGLGIAFLPSHATGMMRASPLLKIIPTPEPGFARHVGLITRRGESLSPAADSFYAFTVAAMGSDPLSGSHSESTKRTCGNRSRKRR